MNDIRVLPLPKVDARYGPMGGKYPETVRIAMSDGKTITYRIDIPQPAPILKGALDQFDSVTGYEKPADAATSNRPAQKGIHHIIAHKEGIHK